METNAKTQRGKSFLPHRLTIRCSFIHFALGVFEIPVYPS